MNNKFPIYTAIGGVVAVVLLVGLMGTRKIAPISPASSLPKPMPVAPVPGAKQSTVSKSDRDSLDATLWADEVAAQKHEAPFTKLWDALREKEDALPLMALMPFERINIQQPGKAFTQLFGISRRESSTNSSSFNQLGFKEQILFHRSQGAKLVQSEWHHSEFRPEEDGEAAHSVFSVGLHINYPKSNRRLAIKGKLDVQWKQAASPEAVPLPGELSFRDYHIIERSGENVFREIPTPQTEGASTMPILVYDLDGDGYSEIISPPRNMILKNRGGMNFVAQPFGQLQPEGVNPFLLEKGLPHMTGTVGDFTGDGKPDVVLAYRMIGAFLYELGPNGQFNPPTRIFAGGTNFLRPQVISTGDVNGDNKLDLWIAQYKEPYRMGNIPDPIFDANDGFPSFLLINEGDRKFRDATEDSGLAEKRFRRTYSGSFWDHDSDGDLDLLVVSDFSGIDLFENDGKGKFKDVTSSLSGERANFGMGHVFGDFDRDKKMDFFVTGMSSTTARRLEALGLKRENFPDITELRMKMAFGNRMYVGGDGSFREPAFRESVARSGWSWGTTAFDFGNDGFLDIYVANGHRSGKTCRDYCTRFWTHDIYSTVKPTDLRALEFKNEQEEWADGSWNGYEKNFLYLNQRGTNFMNSAFALDVAFEYDSRSVIAADLDQDGRQDLIVLEAQNRGGVGNDFDVLHVYRNEWTANGPWIGLNLRPSEAGSEIGAVVRVKTRTKTFLKIVATGDSFNCQHPSVIHFGLGDTSVVDWIEVKWANGAVSQLEKPRLNQYHKLSVVKN